MLDSEGSYLDIRNGHVMAVRDQELVYQSALNSLSCFITPACFPKYNCNNGVPQKVKRELPTEEMAFCTGDLQARQEELKGEASSSGRVEKCLVYSFGIHTSTEWEEKTAKLFGCEVHAFDPTVDHPNTEYVTFHKLGLKGDGPTKATNGLEYNAIDLSLLLSLGEIMRRLGHEGRKVDVLTLDCEGCEWAVLHQLGCNSDGSSELVGQFVVEVHFQTLLGLATDADVIMAGNAIDCLRREGWGMVTMQEHGCRSENAVYTRGVREIMPHHWFLLTTSLKRTPPAGGYLQREVKFDEYPHFPED
jgi:hypothetical protein